ncbi:MAG: single-stranded DNA-binding protein [Verrucomicrobiae bacterium]|nr:single-stranded DNA-binding protein [Verrucomicrobiae bacterium]
MESPREILEMILGHLGLVFEVTEQKSADGLILQIHTRDPRHLIGRDGRVLDELQYLVNYLIDNSSDEEKEHVLIDVEGYREQAKQELIDKVKRIKERVLKTRRPFILEMLNAYQRRILHEAFKKDQEIVIVSPSHKARFKRMTVKIRETEKAGKN